MAPALKGWMHLGGKEGDPSRHLSCFSFHENVLKSFGIYQNFPTTTARGCTEAVQGFELNAKHANMLTLMILTSLCLAADVLVTMLKVDVGQ